MPTYDRPSISAGSRAESVRVSVYAPARLHLGFMDPSGGSGRRFGSLGLAVEGLGAHVCATPADRLEVYGHGGDRLLGYVRALQDELGIDVRLRFEVHSIVPEHAGLGSGTQLALVAGSLVRACCGIDLPPRRTAQILDRGNRSGIGIGAFESGGFVVDGGRGANGSPPPIVSRIAFPPQWRVLLLFDTARSGLSGDAETAAFKTAREFPESESARLCRLVMLRALPALAESDLEEFGAAIGELQRTVGDYFAPSQGGRFTSPDVAAALHWLETHGVTGIGQSSWGPTGFAVVGSESRATALARELRALPECAGLEVLVTRGRNSGAEIEAEPAHAAVLLP